MGCKIACVEGPRSRYEQPATHTTRSPLAEEQRIECANGPVD